MASFTRERGAVNLAFLIVTVIFALVFGVLWFTQLQDNEDNVKKAKAATASAQAAEQVTTFYRDYYSEVAKWVGGGVPGAVPYTDEMKGQSGADAAKSATKAIEEALKGIGSRVDDSVASPKTLIEALDVPCNRYALMKGDANARVEEIKTLNSEKQVKDKTIADNIRAYTEEKGKLVSENEATVNRLTQQANDTRATNEEMQVKVRESGAELDKTRKALNTDTQKAVLEKKELEGQVRSIHGELRTQRVREAPDGTILSAETKSGLAMINITSKSQLRRGTRFKIYETGKGNVKIHKGWLTVTDIGPTMSEGRIDETVAGAGMISAGDWLYNPFFDATSQKGFGFLGQINGRYNRETAEGILKSFGARIDEKVSVRTDFIVLGENEDPEASPITETADYKNAITWGIEILRASDLSPFLQR